MPIGHAWYLWGADYLLGIGVSYYFFEGILLLIGCYIFLVRTMFLFPSDMSCRAKLTSYQTRFPESFFPGRFDIWGHSHTIWHLIVVLSIAVHMEGMAHAMHYHLYNSCPS